MIKKYERFKSGAECITLNKPIENREERDRYYQELEEEYEKK